jgi:hypothetical protein
MEDKALLHPIENGIAKNICGQQVAGKLNPLKGQGERPGQRLRQRCFPNARDVFDQKMTAGEQTSDSEFNSLILAHDNFTNLLCENVNVILHSEIICGNESIRKQDMQL